VFVLLEGLLYGFGWWFFFYLYVWPILVGVALLLRRWNLSWILWTVVGGLFGLFFGPLSALQSLVVGGWPMAFSYWVSGIPFDVLHCVGNAVMCGLFLKPLTGLMTKLAYPSP
jgi:energy-coupling factor transport system substrate-specific component